VEGPRIFTEARFKLESPSERAAAVLWFYTQNAVGHGTASADADADAKCLDGALGLLPYRNIYTNWIGNIAATSFN
jgi:hypothetical protein